MMKAICQVVTLARVLFAEEMIAIKAGPPPEGKPFRLMLNRKTGLDLLDGPIDELAAIYLPMLRKMADELGIEYESFVHADADSYWTNRGPGGHLYHDSSWMGAEADCNRICCRDDHHRIAG